MIETGDNAWIVNAGDGTVLRLDRKTGKRLQTITVGRDPREIALGFGSLWVTNHADNSVTRIDERTGRIVGSAIPVGEGPAWHRDGEWFGVGRQPRFQHRDPHRTVELAGHGHHGLLRLSD